MEDIARTIAEELVEADRLSRLAEARKVMLLAELAANYSINSDDVVEVLAERQLRVGAGAPTVSEYLCLEVGPLLGYTPTAAAGKIADAVNLKHRHPTLYRALAELEIDAARACRAARKCLDLPAELAEQVTAQWLRTHHKYAWTAAFNRLDKRIIDADPTAAAAKERKMREQLGVHVWGFHHGTMNLTGRLEVLDARQLDAVVARLAEILAREDPDATADVLRARALGVLATPERALALLQEGGVPRSGRRPKMELVVHVNVAATGESEGSARVDRAGHITLGTLAEMPPHMDVTVQPVIDLLEVPAEDRYVPSVNLRRALGLAMPTEVFPFSNRASPGLDLDHTVAFRPGRSRQTRMGNLAPLSRRVHRAKTAGVWRVEQPRPTVLVWTSPLGYRYEVHPAGVTQRVVRASRE